MPAAMPSAPRARCAFSCIQALTIYAISRRIKKIVVQRELLVRSLQVRVRALQVRVCLIREFFKFFVLLLVYVRLVLGRRSVVLGLRGVLVLARHDEVLLNRVHGRLLWSRKN